MPSVGKNVVVEELMSAWGAEPNAPQKKQQRKSARTRVSKQKLRKSSVGKNVVDEELTSAWSAELNARQQQKTSGKNRSQYHNRLYCDHELSVHYRAMRDHTQTALIVLMLLIVVERFSLLPRVQQYSIKSVHLPPPPVRNKSPKMP